MDQWRKKPLREERTKNPSFSSTLLDTIYRSIEEEEEHMVMYRETTKKKQSHSGSNQMLSSSTTSNYSFEEEEVENLKRIEKWMEKKVTSDKEQVDIFFNQKQHHAHRRQQQQQLGTLKLDDDDDDDCYNKMAEDEIDHLVFHSNSSSSDSSFYGFSSSEMESWPSASYRSRPRSEKVSRSDDCSSRKTINMVYDHDYKRGSDATAAKNAKLSSGSRALKMYRDLKMKNSSNKPPISPGRRLATFLNSIFTSTRGNGNGNGNGNNANSKVNNKVSSSQSQPTSTTTASSFSRSCLSKTPNSTRKKFRSVRFYPVSVILDEDSQPCGHKSLDPEYKVITTDQQQQLLRFHLMEKNRRIEEAAKDLLLFRNYEKKKISHHHRLGIRESDEDDDDSDSSTSSSDLFELDHLSAGLERRRYREELPVYETTHLRTNRAISNGYLL